jgi:transcriptional regulator with XRE-family HTH domain
MEFSQKLVHLRKQHHLTQGDFAEKVGVTRQAVYKWESGQSYPGAQTLVEMKALFGVSIDDMLDPAVDITAAAEPVSAEPTPAVEEPAPVVIPVSNPAPAPAEVPQAEEPKKKKGFFARLFGN